MKKPWPEQELPVELTKETEKRAVELERQVREKLKKNRPKPANPYHWINR